MMDGKLIQRELIGLFYEEHKPWLYQWLCKKMSSQLDAADIAQDTFVRVLLKEHVEITEPRAYLTRIAHGLMVNSLKRRDIERAYQATLIDPYLLEYPSPEMQALVVEALLAIDEMLNTLPPKVKQAYLMMQLDGLKYKEIAEKLDVSIRTIASYIEKATIHCLIFESSYNGE
jgi:RNA polymerase sigma-70 factor (ECF subfamily)